MSIIEISKTGVTCDQPGCKRIKIFDVSSYEEGWDEVEKRLKTYGWSWVTFPGKYNDYTMTRGFGVGDVYIYSCPKCSAPGKAEIKATPKNHSCIFIARTKKGKLSYYGKYLTCFFCGKIGEEKEK